MPACGTDIGRRELREAWRAYREDGDAAAHELLVLAYLPLVRLLARRAANRLPASARIEEDDLLSAGVLGLMTAIDRFDPERAVKFETFANTRVNGAVLDALRALDPVPRGVRARAKTVARAQAQLAGELRRAPTDSEVAERLELAVSELRGIIDGVANARVVALEDLLPPAEQGATGISVLETIPDPAAPDPAVEVAAREARAELARAVTRLPKRERQVIWLYYHEGRTLREIGDTLDVTESRACQLHGKIMRKLKARLAPETVDAVAA